MVHAPGVGYVAVGRGGAVVTSPDGLSWTPRWTWFPGDLLDVTWDGERFLAVGQCGLVVSSPDGEHWSTEMAMPWSSTLTTVASSGRAAVAAGGGVMVAQPLCTQVGLVRRRLSGPTSGTPPAFLSDSSARSPEDPDPLVSGM